MSSGSARHLRDFLALVIPENFPGLTLERVEDDGQFYSVAPDADPDSPADWYEHQIPIQNDRLDEGGGHFYLTLPLSDGVPDYITVPVTSVSPYFATDELQVDQR